jgi:POTRA domain, FtsQ-type
MRSIQLNILTAAMLSFVGTHHLAPQKNTTVGIVDFYGLRQITEAQVRQALRITEGDTITESTLRSAEKRLRALPGVSNARVDGVCCDNGKTLVYVGIEEKGTPAVHFNPPPKGHARLPDDVVRAGAAFDAAFEKAVEHGDFQEDQSKGHSLMYDPGARAVQEGFVALADRYGQQLRDVLRDSDKREQRALAAQVLGYATDKASVVGDLSAAMHDSDADVRNKAARALWLIAAFAQESPDRKIQVPADPFVDLLNSLTWTDRNKSSLALMSLTEPRDPALLSTLRHKAVPALTEMARWKSRGHAIASVMILGRVAGIPEKDLTSAAAIGSHATIVDTALKRLEAK